MPWPATWRYAERFNRQYFSVSINTGSDLSKQLVAAMRVTKISKRNAMISSLVRGHRDLHMLNQAVADHQAALRTAVPVDMGEPAHKAAQNVVAKKKKGEGGIPRNPSGGKCPLCLSPTHVYRRGRGTVATRTWPPSRRPARSCSRMEQHVGWCTPSQGR